MTARADDDLAGAGVVNGVTCIAEQGRSPSTCTTWARSASFASATLEVSPCLCCIQAPRTNFHRHGHLDTRCSAAYRNLRLRDRGFSRTIWPHCSSTRLPSLNHFRVPERPFREVARHLRGALGAVLTSCRVWWRWWELGAPAGTMKPTKLQYRMASSLHAAVSTWTWCWRRACHG